MTFHVGNSSAWKDVASLAVGVVSAWKDVDRMWIGENGEWKEFFVAFEYYTGNNFSVTSQDSQPTDIAFNGDGTKMFVVGFASATVYEYSLSSGFDITTASYSGNSLSLSAQDTQPHSICFNGLGTIMFIVGGANLAIYEYSLSSGFDITTASYSGNSLELVSSANNKFDLAFNTAGTKMFLLDRFDDAVLEYALSSAFDLSTVSDFPTDDLDLSPTSEVGASGMVFSADGTVLLIADLQGDTIRQYDLSSGFDLATASLSDTRLDVSDQDGSPWGLAFDDDGSHLFVAGLSTGAIYAYQLPANYSLVVP